MVIVVFSVADPEWFIPDPDLGSDPDPTHIFKHLSKYSKKNTLNSNLFKECDFQNVSGGI